MDQLKEERLVAKEELKKAEEAAKAPPQVTQDPLINDWIERNDWFGKDRRLTTLANAIGTDLRQQDPNLMGKAFLERLDAELAETMPEKFGKKKTPNPMDGSPNGMSRPSASKGKKSYENLPSEAKAACDRFVSQKLMTREQYVAEYSWD